MSRLEEYLRTQKKATPAEKITEYYQGIQSGLVSMDSKLNEIVHQHEKDFLCAFRSLMQQVQSELQRLRELSDEQALMVKRDNAVHSLQETLTWFQTEAVKLSETCSRLQVKYDEVRVKAVTLESENRHLEEQVKLLLRQNQVLKEQIVTRPERPDRPELSTPQKRPKPDNLVSLASSYNVTDSAFLDKLAETQKTYQHHLEATVRHYKSIIAKKDLKIKGLISNNCTGFLQKSKLEELFLSCVDEVRREVIRRKSLENSINRSRKIPVYAREQLNTADKRAILENFITQEEVVAVIYDQLFPRTTDSRPAGHKTLDRLGVHESTPSSSKSSARQAVVMNGKLIIDK